MISAGTYNFLCRGSHKAAFWFSDENSGDNTPMVSAVAEQCLHRAKAIFTSHAALPSEEPGGPQEVHKGTQPGQMTQPDQRDIPYRIVSCAEMKDGVKRRRGGTF